MKARRPVLGKKAIYQLHASQHTHIRVLLPYSYLFIDFKSAESAHAAVKNLDGHKLSKTVTLSVNKFTDVEKYSDMNEQYVEPEIAPYEPKEHLKSALMDPQARDQFVMYRGDDVSIFWNRKTDAPEHVYSRTVS